MTGLLTLHGSRMQRLICLLVCMCAWRGPVPVLHQHDLLQADSENLARHMERFHSCLPGCAEAQWAGNDWHWHFALPSQPTEHDGEPAWPDVPPELAAAFAVVSLQSCGGSTVPETVLPVQFSVPATIRVDGNVPDGRPSDGVATSFLQSFARSVPTCALTGVALR